MLKEHYATLRTWTTNAIFLAVLGAFVWFLFAINKAQTENEKIVDEIFTTCPETSNTCSVRKTQNAKFANITQFDYETHVCKDGLSATRTIDTKTLVSTMQLYFVDMSKQVHELAKTNNCKAE